MNKKFFPQKPDVNPTTYGYTELPAEYEGLIKVSYIERSFSSFFVKHLIDNTPFDSPELFSDLGENMVIPNPTREYLLTPFLKFLELC
ncbi:MAG: hypothetical protein OXC03_07375 [Flavobacteriaceae bacterium]|nr:hypothetical protein [Flavobacteriaceae bacterium]